jgi:hypothetical protein
MINEEKHNPLIQRKFESKNVVVKSGKVWFNPMNKHRHPNQIVAVITEGEKMLFLEHPNPIISITIQYIIKQYIINLVL